MFRRILLNPTPLIPRVAMKYKIYSIARVGSTNFKITKMAEFAKEIDVVDESDEEIQRVLQEKDAQNTKQSKGDLKVAEESVENLDELWERFLLLLYFA